MQAPLILGGDTPVQVQVTAGQPDRDGRRPVAVYSRPPAGSGTGTGTGIPAVCHAKGWLSDRQEQAAAWQPGQWPPAGCEPVPVDGLYGQLAARGYDYGPAFRGLRAAWRDGTTVYADVALGTGEEEGYLIHPALLDAMLHGMFLARDLGGAAELPFSWSGVRLGQRHHAAARVRITPAGGSGFRMDAVSDDGTLVAAVAELAARPVDLAQLAAARGQRSPLYELGWAEVTASQAPAQPPVMAVLGGAEAPGQRYCDLAALETAVADGAPVPRAVLVAAGPGAGTDVAAAAHAAAAGMLALLQQWLASDRLGAARLIVLTRNAVAAGDRDLDLDLVQAPVWGLVRSAQSEHHGRIVLIDAGQDEVPDWGSVLGVDEPQLAVRGGRLLAPRLSQVPASRAGQGWPLDPGRVVLITGGTSGLGALVARHLAVRHGARRLLLASRRGSAGEAVAGLAAELAAAGTDVQVRACDAADRGQLAGLLASAGQPVGAVVHAAGVIEDATIESLVPRAAGAGAAAEGGRGAAPG